MDKLQCDCSIYIRCGSTTFLSMVGLAKLVSWMRRSAA